MTPRTTQSGNVFFMILMAVALFASLTFTFSRGIQQSSDNISNRRAALVASDIITHAQKMERAVQAVLRAGHSEADISFRNDIISGYTNPDCAAEDRCEIFKSAQSSLDWQSPPADTNATQAPYFIGVNQVGLHGESVETARRDLVLLLPVKQAVCDQINSMTTKVETWISNRPLNSTTPFTGDYSTPAGSGISWTGTPEERPTGCFCISSGAACAATDAFYFYHVLHARG